MYTLLTALIILLGRLRKRVARNWDFRLERDQPLARDKNLRSETDKPYVYNRLECCDCGLTHGLYIDAKGFLRTIPWRPGSYRYRLRG